MNKQRVVTHSLLTIGVGVGEGRCDPA